MFSRKIDASYEKHAQNARLVENHAQNLVHQTGFEPAKPKYEIESLAALPACILVHKIGIP